MTRKLKNSGSTAGTVVQAAFAICSGVAFLDIGPLRFSSSA